MLDECHGLAVEVFQPGDRLVTENAGPGPMFVLIEGTVEIVRGGIALMRVSAPGSMIGEMSALLSKPYTASVIAVSPVKAYRVVDAEPFLRDRPGVAFRTAQLLAQRLDNATAYLADVKTQYDGRDDHFGMIDEVLGTLMHQCDERIAARDAARDDPRL